jgi:ribosomal protein L34E
MNGVVDVNGDVIDCSRRIVVDRKGKGKYGVPFDKNAPVAKCGECGRPLYVMMKGPTLYEKIFGNGVRRSK